MYKVLDFDDAVRELEGSDHVSLLTSATAFQIAGPLSASGLQRLTALPFEVLISADGNGTIVLSTGTSTRARHKDDLEAKQRVYGELSIHTHPHEDGIVANAPSLSDIQLSETVNALRSEPRTEYIAHAKGVIMYSVAKECEAERITFYEKRGVSIVRGDEKNGYRNVRNAPRGERVALVRSFCEEMGIILKEALWDDADKVREIVAYMNDVIRAIRK